MEVGKVRAKTSSFQWEVDIDSINNKGTGEKLLSPKFSLHHADNWRLYLYPKGVSISSENYLSLFLAHLAKNEVTVRYYLALINSDNKRVCKISNKGRSLFSLKTSCKGFVHFVSRSFIMDSKNNLLKNNKLTFLCKVMILENAVKSDAEIQIEKNLIRLKQFDKYEELLINKELSDVTVTSEGKNFYLHKNILAIGSDVFKVMFRNDMKEKNESKVTISDIKYDVLQELFQFIYTGKVSNIKEIAGELLIAAEKYCIEELKVLCEEALCNSLYRKNALEYLNLAIINRAEKLKAYIIQYISFDSERYLKSEEFKDLGRQHPEVLIEILSECTSCQS